MQKRTVVLGGAGFIGTHLCLGLLEAGHEVFCVDIRDAANSPLLRNVLRHPSFRYVHHNVVNHFGIRCDEIYNLTAPSRVRYDKVLPVETMKVSVLGSIHSLDTARAEHARVVMASSGCVFDPVDAPGGTSGSDCSTHRMICDGKRAAEALHRAYRSEFGVDTRIARIYNTYGSGAEAMDQRVVMKMIVAALQNRDIHIHGNGEQVRTFCWVEDIADGLMRLMEAPPTEHTRTVSLGGIRGTTIRALAERIVDLTGSRSRIVHVPAREDESHERIPDITAARRELGWMPRTSLSEGLRRTIGYAEKELAGKNYAQPTWVEMN